MKKKNLYWETLLTIAFFISCQACALYDIEQRIEQALTSLYVPSIDLNNYQKTSPEGAQTATIVINTKSLYPKRGYYSLFIDGKAYRYSQKHFEQHVNSGKHVIALLKYSVDTRLEETEYILEFEYEVDLGPGTTGIVDLILGVKQRKLLVFDCQLSGFKAHRLLRNNVILKRDKWD